MELLKISGRNKNCLQLDAQIYIFNKSGSFVSNSGYESGIFFMFVIKKIALKPTNEKNLQKGIYPIFCNYFFWISALYNGNY